MSLSDNDMLSLVADSLRSGLEVAREELGMLILEELAGNGTLPRRERMQSLLKMLEVGYPATDNAMFGTADANLTPLLDYFKENQKP